MLITCGIASDCFYSGFVCLVFQMVPDIIARKKASGLGNWTMWNIILWQDSDKDIVQTLYFLTCHIKWKLNRTKNGLFIQGNKAQEFRTLNEPETL